MRTAQQKTGGTKSAFARKSLRRNIARTAGTDLHALFNMSANCFFKEKSLLTLYREAGYVYERIPEDQIPKLSMLGMLRLSQTELVLDPVTGKRVLPDSPLVRRSREIGIYGDELLEMGSLMKKSLKKAKLPEGYKPPIPEGYTYQEDSLGT